ncbi:hypothetical protein [Paraburkholderia ferrariae]|uniref:Uncharacterized protein n=1 Tax=Paraburkholderia ferrariae TaxID=386056 RepID=A0ABU9RIX6_9BURK
MSSFHRADWLALASPLVTLAIVVSGYYVAYWQERGKSRAAAENIDKLTRAVEDIKTENAARLAEISHQNAILIEQLKSKHQLRVAAIDRRLQAHQEAFKLWRKLYAKAHSDEVSAIIRECQAWWEDNCLYLDEKSRNAFANAYWAAGHHKMLLQSPVRDEAAIASITRNWAMIEGAGDAIVSGAALPGLTEAEKKELREAVEANKQGG